MADPKTYYEDHALAWLRAGRAIFYQPEDHTGFGNRLRGLLGAFALALVSKRFLFVEDPFIDAVFKSPFQFSWSSRHHRVSKKLARQAVEYVWPLRPDNWSDAFWFRVSSGSLENFPHEPVIWYAATTSFYDAVMENPHHRLLLADLEIQPTNKIQSVGTLTEILLSELRPYWRKALRELKSQDPEWDDPKIEKIGVQYRSFADSVKDQRSQDEFETFVCHLVRVVEKKEPGRSPYMFIVASDRLDYRERLEKILSNYSKVRSYSTEIGFTGGSSILSKTDRHNWTYKVFKKLAKTIRILFYRRAVKILRRTTEPSSLPEKFIQAIREWLLLGECDFLISTFTTFTVFAAARRGNQARMYKIDPTTGYYGIPEGEGYVF